TSREMLPLDRKAERETVRPVRGRAIVVVALGAIMLAAALYCWRFFGGYSELADGNDYAGLARSLARGEGFSLGHVYSLSLAFDSHVTHPDNHWALCYPVYLSLWFLFWGAHDLSALSAAVVALWFFMFSAYLLARRSDARLPALAVAALLALNQGTLY